MANISDLDPANPTGVDPVSDGDNQIQSIKDALATDFGGIDGPVYEDADDQGAGGTTLVSAATMSSWQARILALEAFVANPAGTSIPVGGIILWDTASNPVIPTGWAVCDGTRYEYSLPGGGTDFVQTPDYRGRFVAGASAGGLSPGDTGGTPFATRTVAVTTASAGNHNHINSVTAGVRLTLAQIPGHNHTLFAPGTGTADLTGALQPAKANRTNDNNENYHISAGTIGEAATLGYTGSQGGEPGQAANHQHAVGDTGINGAHTHTADVTPPYWASEYIMYIADGVPA